jgi:hypothetical protein
MFASMSCATWIVRITSPTSRMLWSLQTWASVSVGWNPQEEQPPMW